MSVKSLAAEYWPIQSVGLDRTRLVEGI